MNRESIARIAEGWGPGILASLVGAIASGLTYRWPVYFAGLIPDLMPATLGLASILIGFLSTVKSILIAIDERQAIRRFRETEKYVDFLDYIWHALTGSFYLAAISGVGLFFTKDLLLENLWLLIVSHGLWSFSVVYCLLAVRRVSRVLYKLLRQASRIETGKNEKKPESTRIELTEKPAS